MTAIEDFGCLGFSSIEIALDLYKLDNSNFPPVNLGMSALANSDGIGYLNKTPVDPWGTDYRLDYQGDKSTSCPPGQIKNLVVSTLRMIT